MEHRSYQQGFDTITQTDQYNHTTVKFEFTLDGKFYTAAAAVGSDYQSSVFQRTACSRHDTHAGTNHLRMRRIRSSPPTHWRWRPESESQCTMYTVFVIVGVPESDKTIPTLSKLHNRLLLGEGCGGDVGD